MAKYIIANNILTLNGFCQRKVDHHNLIHPINECFKLHDEKLKAVFGKRSRSYCERNDLGG